MRKTIIGIVSLLLWTTCNANAQTQMQQEFEKFLSLFPTITWDDLSKVIRNYELIESRQQIPYEVLRRNMWYEEPQNGPKNVYNHIKNEIKSADYGYATPPPHIIDIDGDYVHYEKLGGYGEVYPIGKVEVARDIILLILYNSHNPDVRSCREFYTFKKSTQQMISAYLVIDSRSDAYVVNDFTFIFFEDHANELSYDESVYTDARYAHRKIVKLLSNGYFAEKEKQTGIYHCFGYTQDSDGYSNVRKSPSAKSEILYQITDSSYVSTYGTPDGSWFEVVYVIEKGSENISVEKHGGYIHKSRFRDFEKWRNSLRSPEYKE